MLNSELPDPLVPPEVDLRDWRYMPLLVARLFGSTFHAQASDAAWRAGVTLWLKSWHQIPAGTLPNDDRELCRLAELGADFRKFARVREWALHGWFLCSDGKLHNYTMAEVVLEAWEKRKANKEKASNAAKALWRRRNATSNATSDASGMHGASNKHANRGQVEVSSSEEDKSSSAKKAPSTNPSDWLWAEGLQWLVTTTNRKEGPIRSFLGKCRQTLKNDDARLRTIIEQAMATNPAEPFAWISAAIQSRQAHEPDQPDQDPLYAIGEADLHLAKALGAVATDVLNFKRQGIWFPRIQGPKPDDPACQIDPVILSRHGYADPAIYETWAAKLAVPV